MSQVTGSQRRPSLMTAQKWTEIPQVGNFTEEISGRQVELHGMPQRQPQNPRPACPVLRLNGGHRKVRREGRQWLPPSTLCSTLEITAQSPTWEPLPRQNQTPRPFDLLKETQEPVPLPTSDSAFSLPAPQLPPRAEPLAGCLQQVHSFWPERIKQMEGKRSCYTISVSWHCSNFAFYIFAISVTIVNGPETPSYKP